MQQYSDDLLCLGVTSYILTIFSADPKGNVGVVHYVEDETDLDWLLQSGVHGPYAVLLKPVYFNRYCKITSIQGAQFGPFAVTNIFMRS